MSLQLFSSYSQKALIALCENRTPYRPLSPRGAPDRD
jgi:hypothetical protein